MFKRYVFFLIALFAFQVFAQENLTTTDNAQIEVQTTSLEKNSKAQKLRVVITCNTLSQNQKMKLRLADASAVPVLISATRNNEDLWLVQAQTAHENATVLAWQTLEDNSLQLLPGNWIAPYELSLEIQISLNNVIDLENVENTRLDLFLISGDTETLTSTTGRGNQISLKNTRE